MADTFIHVQTLQEISQRKPTFLAIGSFDGVHIGHQTVLKKLVEAGQKAGVQTAVLTFFPHPKRVVRNLTGPYYLSTLDERINIIRDLGVDLLITHRFDDTVRLTKAADFVDQLLAVMDLKQLWGGDIALGHNREGNVPFLRRLGQELGFTVETTDHLTTINGEIVSSSRIRELLLAGNVSEVAACLGRPYQVSGAIAHGDQRGRTIGFPTANIDVWPEQLLPANGVYATLATLDGITHFAATNIGTRPTVNGRSVRVEAHLLNFNQTIYGENLQLQFIKHIRPEMKFNGLDALKLQIKEDTIQIEEILTQYRLLN